MTAEVAEHPYNRHLFISDNYDLLRSLPSESIDLITTDPPFAKNGTFVGSLKPALSSDEIAAEREMLASWGIAGPRDASAAGIEWPTGETTAKFKDIWTWEGDVHEEWMDLIASDWPAVREVIEAAQHAHSEGVAAYICYMAVRLIECHRVLKPTGSLYLHCDHTANSYLRALMDSVFGYKNFRNEVVWCYRGGGVPGNAFARKHDTIIFYGVSSKENTFHRQHVPYSEASQRLVESRGGTSIDGKERDLDRGAAMPDWWIDINSLQTWSPERTGYPTQKPWALAERIIKASSNPGDVVLDPFAGCAYTAVAAEDLGRQWIACDISPRALTVLRRQFAKKGWAIDGEASADETGQGALAFVDVTTVGPHGIPERDHSADPVRSVKPLPKRKFKVPASDMSNAEMKSLLAEVAGYQCWACGFAPRDVKGSVVESADHFHLDHIEPKSLGGSNYVHNRALLCAPCNGAKSAQRVPLKNFRDDLEVAARRASYGHDDYPVDIDAVQTEAILRWSAWRTSKGLDAPTLPLG